VSAARTDPALAGTSFDIAAIRQPLDRAVATLAAPDVLGVSLYPWNAAYSLAVAAAARRAHPDLRIVAGGPSVPRRPDAARRFLDEHPAVDALVFSECELTFRALLGAWRRGESLDGIGGIAFRRDGAHAFTAPARLLDLDALPSPYLDGTFDELLDRHRAHFWIAACETNRGCPFSCTFCDWSLTRNVVELPLARVEAELTWIATHGFGHLLITDANFGIRATPRSRGTSPGCAAPPAARPRATSISPRTTTAATSRRSRSCRAPASAAASASPSRTSTRASSTR
jgi:radical SAM superfamily enzyme YgiQ (UPF0313 family)